MIVVYPGQAVFSLVSTRASYNALKIFHQWRLENEHGECLQAVRKNWNFQFNFPGKEANLK